MVSQNEGDSQIRQYVATQKGGPFAVTHAPYPTPGPNELCIRNVAVGLNPLDWKNLYHGEMVKAWPEIFGIDTAGIVVAVGENVTAFKPGDAVMSLSGHGGRAGAFQDVTTVPANFATRKPVDWTFEEACSVPICYLTAAAAVAKGLGVSLFQDQAASNALPLNSILVLGGSSGVGASAVQLLRAALPHAAILTTNSRKHNVHVLSLGATACIDRNEPDIVAAIRAASPTGQGVDAILDAVAGVPDNGQLFETLRSDGPRLYSQVFTGTHQLAIPERVSAQTVFGRMVFQMPGGFWAMEKLSEMVSRGQFKLPLRVVVVGKGLEAIGSGLEILRAGVSGTKLVVSL
ncbi:chaperonin 10-like protein [Chaetomium strumarium]|uniref:Chaperonin 10-like protein n=1 Tax=Chaetomium strumarium TaxID=1170767 RepID=A0AAJ0M010_9PEZI|nr:chaperonin 10-like protein [Chaetomium strumarium]